MKVTRIGENEFIRMQASWNGVLQNSRTDEVFLLWEWIDSWWTIFRNPARELFIIQAFNDAGKTIGFAPLYRENLTLLGLRYGKILKLCGDPETYPDHLDFFCEEHWEEEFLKAIFRYLQEHLEAWDYIDLNGLSESSIIRDFLKLGDPGLGDLRWGWRDYSECPYVGTPGNFKSYLESFSGKKRYTLLKRRRLLCEGEVLTVQAIKTPDEIEKYLDTLFSLHAERAQRKGINSTFMEEKVGAFHRKLIGGLLKKGKVDFSVLYRKDFPLAAIYCFRHNSKYYYYQSGISNEGERHSAGLVLLSMMIEKCFDEGYREFDFLRGAEEYKYYWTKTSRKNLTLEISKENGRGRFARMVHHWQKEAPVVYNRVGRVLRSGKALTKWRALRECKKGGERVIQAHLR
jgi:CelD/BcsL family acetyltransferase involved in cellulose biosynthesis